LLCFSVLASRVSLAPFLWWWCCCRYCGRPINTIMLSSLVSAWLSVAGCYLSTGWRLYSAALISFIYTLCRLDAEILQNRLFYRSIMKRGGGVCVARFPNARGVWPYYDETPLIKSYRLELYCRNTTSVNKLQ